MNSMIVAVVVVIYILLLLLKKFLYKFLPTSYFVLLFVLYIHGIVFQTKKEEERFSKKSANKRENKMVKRSRRPKRSKRTSKAKNKRLISIKRSGERMIWGSPSQRYHTATTFSKMSNNFAIAKKRGYIVRKIKGTRKYKKLYFNTGPNAKIVVGSPSPSGLGYPVPPKCKPGKHVQKGFDGNLWTCGKDSRGKPRWVRNKK